MKNKIIMIAGHKHAGKSTLAHYLTEAIALQTADRPRGQRHKVEMVNFADPLFRVQEMFTSKENRRFLQGLGNLARECFGADALEQLFEDTVMDALARKNIVVVCDDMRTVGELELAKRLGAATVWVDADSFTRKARGEALGTWSRDNLKPDQDLPSQEFNYLAFNCGTLEHLIKMAKSIIAVESGCFEEIAVQATGNESWGVFGRRKGSSITVPIEEGYLFATAAETAAERYEKRMREVLS